jgi:hypothetical protein
MRGIAFTEKEFKQFQKIEHKRKVTEDAQELGVPGLAKTIFAMERRIAKLEKQAKAKDTRLNNIMGRLITLEVKK